VPPDGWRVYLDDLPITEVAPECVYTYTFPGPPWPGLYTVSAFNAAGESPPSNAIYISEPSGAVLLGALLIFLAVLGRLR
jgi:hypothetical protein